MYRALIFFGCFSCASIAVGQSVNVPLNEDYLHKAERYRILGAELSDELHPGFKPYQRQKLVNFIEGLDREGLNDRDRFNISYMLNDSWEYAGVSPESKRPFLKRFYRMEPDAFHVEEDKFSLHVNPVLHFMGGSASNDDNPVWINTRGVEVRGMIDDKVGFYSFIGENQIAVPAYVDAYPNRLPGVGFQKNFKNIGYDFFMVRGYMSVQATEHINAQFGYDRHKIGQGMRSLFMSDFSPPNLYFRLQTNIWKFNYTNLYTQLVADRTLDPNGAYPLKYLTLHHLSLNLGKKVNIGLFEAVVHGGSGYYDLKYLNPIIFYRAVEHQTGSADNVIVGMDWEWLITRGISFYGQFVMDEFLLSEIKNGTGWWANKFGLQLGATYFDIGGIDNLDLRMEWNSVRPYTYSHRTMFTNYANFEQAMAHPWGANFRETLAEIRYQPLDRLEISMRGMIGTVGRDDNNTNWGSDILKDYSTREQDQGNETTQGFPSEILLTRLKASYMFRHNLFIDLKYIYRREKSSLSGLSGDTHILGAALRLNIADINYDL